MGSVRDEFPVPDQYLQCIIPLKEALDVATENPDDFNQIVAHVGMAHAEIDRLFGESVWEGHEEYFVDLQHRLETAEQEEYPDLIREGVQRFLDETADVDDLTEGLI